MCAASYQATSLDDLEANPGLPDELYAEERRLPTTLLYRPAGSDDRRAWDPSSANYRAPTKRASAASRYRRSQTETCAEARYVLRARTPINKMFSPWRPTPKLSRVLAQRHWPGKQMPGGKNVGFSDWLDAPALYLACDHGPML